MGTSISKSPGAIRQPVTFEAVRDQLRRILASATFSESERLRSLLSFLIEQTMLGHADQIKESVIAVEVFHRPAGFAPRTDSLVRVQVRNLRRKLDEYYAVEGLLDPVSISLPKGSYVPEFRLSSPVPAPAGGRRSRQGWKVVLAAAAVAGLGAGSWWASTVRAGPPQPVSLAVLPFANVGGPPDSDYLGDGFADELTSALEARPGLRVAPRNLAFQFKGTSPDTRAAAGRLGVRAILSGSIQPYADRLKVTAQLVDGRNGAPVWSQSFDRKRGEAAIVMDGVVRGVTAALKVAGPPPPAREHLPSAEVEALYLRGVYLRAKRDPDSKQRGLECLEQAAAKDPAYAPALAAFAQVCVGLVYHAAPHKHEWAEKAESSARRALAADEGNAKAHGALAWVNWVYDRDWAAAESGFRRALELDPNYAGAHNVYGLGLSTRGRFNEAIAQARRAREIDPITYTASTDLALVNFMAGRFAEVESLARTDLSLNPGFAPAHMLIGESLAGFKRYADALREFRQIGPEDADDTEILARLGYTLARSGDKAAALAAAQRIPEAEDSGADVCYNKALVYAGLGDRDRAMEWLDQSADRREASVVFAGVDPFFEDLRGDPRFAALRKRLGLE